MITLTLISLLVNTLFLSYPPPPSQLFSYLDRVQLNFLHLTSNHATQRISISSHQPCQHQLDKIHFSHSKWKDRDKWPLEALTARGERLSSLELMEHWVGCNCSKIKNQSSATQEECSLQFEMNSELTPSLYNHIPIVDMALSHELCQEQFSSCIIEFGPICFHQSHQTFSGG